MYQLVQARWLVGVEEVAGCLGEVRWLDESRFRGSCITPQMSVKSALNSKACSSHIGIPNTAISRTEP